MKTAHATSSARSQDDECALDRGEDPANLRWLFVDLNAFFASVEQQMNPNWRGSIGLKAGLPDYVGAKIAFTRIPDKADFYE